MIEEINKILEDKGSKFRTKDGFTICMYIGHLTFLKRTFDCKYAGNGSNYPHIFFVCGHILADNGYSIPYYRVRTALRQVLYNDASCGFAGGEQ